MFEMPVKLGKTAFNLTLFFKKNDWILQIGNFNSAKHIKEIDIFSQLAGDQETHSTKCSIFRGGDCRNRGDIQYMCHTLSEVFLFRLWISVHIYNNIVENL